MDNMLIKRCLAYGVKIYPFQLSSVLAKYEQYQIPDEPLSKMSEQEVAQYVRGLELTSREAAYDWTRGHELLKTLGFEEVRREAGHRVFVSLAYVGAKELPNDNTN